VDELANRLRGETAPPPAANPHALTLLGQGYAGGD
jgi:hypothetical protein